MAYRRVPHLTVKLLKQIQAITKAEIKRRGTVLGGHELLEEPGVVKAMKALGFRWKYAPQGGVSCNGFFLHRKKNLIVKQSYTCEKKPKHAVPTAEVNGWNVFVQPLCNVSDRAVKKAIAYIRRKDERGFGADVHEGNCGLFRGKPVVFDW